MNKKLKVLSSTALAATLVVPVAAPAFAASTIKTAQSPASVTNESTTRFNTDVIVEVSEHSFTTTNDSFTLRLPSGSTGNLVGVDVYSDTSQVSGAITSPTSVTGQNEFKIDVDSTVPGFNKAQKTKFVVKLQNVSVPAGHSGNLDAEIEAKPGSAFTSGKVTIATVGKGVVTPSIDDVVAIENSGTTIKTIRLKEDRPGAMANHSQSMKLKLPTGFKWKGATDNNGYLVSASRTVGSSTQYDYIFAKNAWGNEAYKIKKDDDRTLYVDTTQAFAASDIHGGTSGTASSSARYLTIDGLQVAADSTDAKTGDVELTLSGESSYSTSTLVIGNYGEYTAAVSATSKDVYAGATDTKIGDITIKEDAPGTLLQGRLLKLTLSGNAKWHVDKNGEPVGPKIKSSESKENNFTFSGGWEFSGSDKTTIQRKIGTPSTNKAATIVLEQGKIDVAPTASGDVKVIIDGSAGVRGEAVVAKATAPVTVEVASKKDVVIGTQEQEISDIIIKEVAAENIDKGSLVLEFPSGVRPSLPSSVEVEGDIKIDKAGITRSGSTLTIPVTTTSSKPATLKVKGLKLVVDRTVPEGDVKVKIKGDSVFAGYDVTTNGKTEKYRPFSESEYVAEGVVANVTTPGAGKGTAATAVFKLNSKTFTVNGKSVEMDVQPLVKWDRAYVPVRFAANALGVADENILWDDKTQTVTISKDGKIVQMTVGKKEYTVNGVKVPMDAPVLRNKAETNNRTMLPLRYIANALNVPVDWNKETSEITLGEVK